MNFLVAVGNEAHDKQYNTMNVSCSQGKGKGNHTNWETTRLTIVMVQIVWAGVQVHNNSNGTGVEPGTGTLPWQQPSSSSFTPQFRLGGFTYPVKSFP